VLKSVRIVCRSVDMWYDKGLGCWDPKPLSVSRLTCGTTTSLIWPAVSCCAAGGDRPDGAAAQVLLP
jgi:hypothetical protein